MDQWVVIGIIFGQISAGIGLAEHLGYGLTRTQGPRAAFMGGICYLVGAVYISINSFGAVIRLMMNDTVCTVI